MIEIHDVINRYNELALTNHLGQDSWRVMENGLRQNNLIFGERLLTTVLRPFFYTRRGWDYLRTRSEIMLDVFRKASDAMMIDADLRRQVHLMPIEEELIQIIQTGLEVMDNE